MASLCIMLAVTACGMQQMAEPSEVHVAPNGNDAAGKGTEDAPYATVSRAAKAMPGTLIIVHGGDYGPIRLGADCSGSGDSPTIIRAAKGEKAVVHAGSGTGISLTNTCHISIEGLAK